MILLDVLAVIIFYSAVTVGIIFFAAIAALIAMESPRLVAFLLVAAAVTWASVRVLSGGLL